MGYAAPAWRARHGDSPLEPFATSVRWFETTERNGAPCQRPRVSSVNQPNWANAMSVPMTPTRTSKDFHLLTQ